MLEAAGAVVDYHDPYISRIKPSREHGHLTDRRSVPLTPKRIGGADAVLIVTDHDSVDYRLIAKHARLVVDTRNAMAKAGAAGRKIVKA
jgi:UDP-N-acetyl-D-glucosamine dehydrogenase